MHLIANCLIVQGHLDELNEADGRQDVTAQNVGNQNLDMGSLATSPSLISELCQAQKIEAKSKISLMIIDCLALTLDNSPNKQRTEQILTREISSSG